MVLILDDSNINDEIDHKMSINMKFLLFLNIIYIAGYAHAAQEFCVDSSPFIQNQIPVSQYTCETNVFRKYAAAWADYAQNLNFSAHCSCVRYTL